MERQPAEGEKVFANDMADKGLISNVYKQLQLNILKRINKQTTPLKNGRV